MLCYSRSSVMRVSAGLPMSTSMGPAHQMVHLVTTLPTRNARAATAMAQLSTWQCMTACPCVSAQVVDDILDVSCTTEQLVRPPLAAMHAPVRCWLLSAGDLCFAFRALVLTCFYRGCTVHCFSKGAFKCWTRARALLHLLLQQQNAYVYHVSMTQCLACRARQRARTC